MKKIIWIAIVIFTACASRAQDPGTGAYAFASIDNRGFDAVNLGNLNTRFTIPIISRTGRGLPFVYTIQNEGLIWQPVTNGSTTVWTPDPSWGFNGQLNGTGFTGYLSYFPTLWLCGNPRFTQSWVPYYTNYVYHDAFGSSHAFTFAYKTGCSGTQPTTTGSRSSTDGSGYTISGTFQVSTLNGTIITPATSTNGGNVLSITDSNGNTISSSGGSSIIDTLGVTALTISGSNPITYTYPVTLQANTATTAKATLTYAPYTVRTNFGCSGIVEYGSNTVNLVSSITLADGSYYTFTYEGTPGATDGAVTGRVASITLPTGGVISYNYTGGGCNGTSGINSDGTVSGLTRTTADGIRTYSRTTISGTSTSTTMQDEKGNQSVLTFTSASGLFYETHRKVYQGTTSGSLLMERFTCYNGATASCDGVAITPPLTEADVTESYNGGSQTLERVS
jgi:hypothetical protein